MQSMFLVFTLFASSVFGLTIRQNVPQCVNNCLVTGTNNFATYQCSSASDFLCLCQSNQFIEDVSKCEASTCTESDAKSGLAYGNQVCNSVGVEASVDSYASSVIAADTVTRVTGTASVPPAPLDSATPNSSSTTTPGSSARTTTTAAPTTTTSSSGSGNNSGSSSGAEKTVVSGLVFALVGVVGALMM